MDVIPLLQTYGSGGLQYYGAQPKEFQQTTTAQALHSEEPKRRPPRHTGSSGSLAARINGNLASDQVKCIQFGERKVFFLNNKLPVRVLCC